MRYYLTFENETPNRVVEIYEPFGADASTMTIEQKGLARDVYIYNQDNVLEFTNGEYGNPNNVVQYDIEGRFLDGLTHALDYILDTFNIYGSESLIRLTYDDNGTILDNGHLDLEQNNFSTDLITYLKCGTIEASKRFIHKIRDEILCNVYATKDLDANTIIPLTPIKVLLKSKPITSSSRLDVVSHEFRDNIFNILPAGGGYRWLMPQQQIITYGIEDTFSPTPFRFGYNSLAGVNDGNFMILKAKTQLNNIKIEFKNLDVMMHHVYNGVTGYLNRTTLGIYYRIGSGFDNVIFEKQIIDTATVDFNFPTSLSVNIPSIVAGEILQVYYFYDYTDSTLNPNAMSGNIYDGSYFKYTKGELYITATSIDINSIVQGVRPIDLMKQTTLMTSKMDVDAPFWDISGKYWNQLAINGYGIRNLNQTTTTISGVTTTTPASFNITSKSSFEIVKEVCGDYQLNPNKIKVGGYENFYPDLEIAVLSKIASSDFKWSVNEKYRLKTIEFKYNTYEQDRQEQNTIDAVHTDAQWLMPNKRAQTVKSIDVKHIRDPYSIEKQRRLGLDNTQTFDTSLITDDSLTLIDLVDIGSDTTQVYTGVFSQQASSSELKILSNTFNWQNLGLNIGATFVITNCANAGNYIILSIEKTILTLSGSPSILGNSTTIMTLQYTIFGVTYKNRTNEGFYFIDGIQNPENFSNLKFHIRRNIQNFEPILATASMRVPNGKIKRTYQKSNGKLKTQLTGSSIIYDDAADILEFEIKDKKIITDLVFEAEYYCSSILAMQIISNIQENSLGTMGGYIRCLDLAGNPIKGYPMKDAFLYSEGKLQITCEQKYEVDIYVIVKSLVSWFEINNGICTLYDANSIPLEKRRINKYSISGIIYNDVDNFNNAITLFLL